MCIRDRPEEGAAFQNFFQVRVRCACRKGKAGNEPRCQKAFSCEHAFHFTCHYCPPFRNSCLFSKKFKLVFSHFKKGKKSKKHKKKQEKQAGLPDGGEQRVIAKIVFSVQDVYKRQALLGAVLLVFSDIISRTLLIPNEIPIGIVAAVIGAPYFLYLLIMQD